MNRKPEKHFLARIKERKLIRVGIVYVFVGWVLIQIGEVSFEALRLPEWSLALLIVIVFLGFPLALVLAWAYELGPGGVAPDPAEALAGGQGSTRPSIAVLPFDDLSEHGDQAYFCEGIAEEILNALCKIPGLRVASRVTAFQFGGRDREFSIGEISEKLGVRTLLEGSVRKSGERLRITAQLIEAANGYHLWSRQYDRALEDIFSI
jgi:TolB-like protein